MDGAGRLEFAYKYPFSSAAKEVVAGQGNNISQRYLEMSKRHIETAISEGLRYIDARLSYVRSDYVMTYLYARMLLSAIRDPTMIKSYANAEAERSVEAAYSADVAELLALCADMGFSVSPRFDPERGVTYREFAISLEQYITNAPRQQKAFDLVNQRLSAGTVIIDKDRMRGLLVSMIAAQVEKGLPIKLAELPKDVVDYAKPIRATIRKPDTVAKPAGRNETRWIENLLNTPIADVRHRTVNLILAPYLTNVKGMSVDDAANTIIAYIEKCKLIEPSTKVNEKYIRYQCEYAKRRELKPLSFERARELLEGAIDIESLR